MDFPIDGYVVVLLESVDEVVGVDFGEVFYSKVIGAQGKFCFEGAVLPQDSGVWHWFVSVWCKLFDKLVESDYVGFLEAVHTFADFEVYESVI